MGERMFKFLSGFRKSRPPYRDRDRFIFRYWNGMAWVKDDPLEIRRRLDKEGGENWMTVGRLMATTHLIGIKEETIIQARLKQADEAKERTCALVRSVFRIAPVANGGLTESECNLMLAQYLNFMREAGESASFFPRLPETTDAPASESPTGSTSA